jgi:hypothetical protein
VTRGRKTFQKVPITKGGLHLSERLSKRLAGEIKITIDVQRRSKKRPRHATPFTAREQSLPGTSFKSDPD